MQKPLAAEARLLEVGTLPWLTVPSRLAMELGHASATPRIRSSHARATDEHVVVEVMGQRLSIFPMATRHFGMEHNRDCGNAAKSFSLNLLPLPLPLPRLDLPLDWLPLPLPLPLLPEPLLLLLPPLGHSCAAGKSFLTFEASILVLPSFMQAVQTPALFTNASPAHFAQLD